MFCTQCGNEMTEGTRFCPQCGAQAGGARPQNPYQAPPNPPLARDIAHKKIAGVCAGVARHMGADVTLVRIVFLTAFVFSGVGLVAYIIGWICMPRDDSRPYNATQPV